MRTRNFILPLLIIFFLIVITGNAMGMSECNDDSDPPKTECGSGGSYSTNRVYDCQCISRYNCNWVQIDICTSPYVCSDGYCVCVPSCGANSCGQSDGCGGECTRCPVGYVCYEGECKEDCTTACQTGARCCDPHSGGLAILTERDIWTPDGCHSNCYESYNPNVVHTCQIDQRCYRYNVPAFDCGVKICFECVNAPSYCCEEGITADSTAECRQCNAAWALANGHCCGSGKIWGGSQCCLDLNGVCSVNTDCCSNNCNAKPGNTQHCCPLGQWWVVDHCEAVSEFPSFLFGIIGVVIVVLLAIFIPKLVSKKKSTNKK